MVTDIRQLRHFLAVAEELHFGRAAERLGITQPPLSQSIQALEAELGVALFTRNRRMVALTPVGAAWLPHVRRVVSDAAALPVLARRIARGEVGTVRLGFVSTAIYSLLPDLVAKHKAGQPDVELHLFEQTSDIQIDGLLERTVDVGLIIPPARALHPALRYRPLLREPLIAAVPTGWIDSGQLATAAGGVSVTALAEKPLLLFPRHSAPAFHDLVTGYLATAQSGVPLGQEAVQMQTIISLVSAGLGFALVPQSLRNLARAGVSFLPLSPQPPSVELGIAWHYGTVTPAADGFIATALREAGIR